MANWATPRMANKWISDKPTNPPSATEGQKYHLSMRLYDSIQPRVAPPILMWECNAASKRLCPTVLSAVLMSNSTEMITSMALCRVYPKKYAHGFCFAVLCCGYTLTDFPISIRLTSLALWQSNDCPSASKAALMNMDKYFMWIHYERLHNHNKAKHNKTVCIFLGNYCMLPYMSMPYIQQSTSGSSHNLSSKYETNTPLQQVCNSEINRLRAKFHKGDENIYLQFM